MDFILNFLDVFLFFGLLVLGFSVGRWKERRHYKSIREREAKYANILAFAVRYPPDVVTPQDCQLVAGSVVISSDYFKQIVAGLRTLIGGKLSSYESLLDRARREATLRMKEQAQRFGATLVINVKVESTTVSGGTRRGLPAMEVIAYGTALKPRVSPTTQA
ncbi:MAG: YbjQ family protein [Betaproteobacteria bacterium]|nr:YbjQ family protein [Betaproteobacteria bacterium]